MTPRQKVTAKASKTKAPRHALGASRLDVLLDGGLRRGDVGMIHGPSFMGKAILGRLAIREALAQKQPVIIISTRQEGPLVMEKLGIGEKGNDLLQIIDTFSAGLGQKTSKGTKIVNGPTDLNGIAAALNTAQAAIQGKHDDHLLVVDSVSTLIAHNTPEAIFRFLQVMLGSSRRAGARTLLLLDDGMHAGHDVESLKHVSTGTIHLRDLEGKHQVRILGFDASTHLGWIDYHAKGDQFDVVGSFAAGRIR